MSGQSFFHDCLSDLERIFNAAGLEMSFHAGFLDVPCRRKGLRQWKILRKHWEGFRALKKQPTPRDGHFIREFSTVPAWLCLKLMRVPADSLSLLVNHNLQWALTRPLNRLAFRSLQRSGVRLVFFEFVPEAALHSIGMQPGRCLAIPMPIKKLNPGASAGAFSAGLMGRWTAESRGAVTALLQAEGVARLLIGAPNIREAEEACRNLSERIAFRDTTDPDAFDEAIQACRIIYLPYNEAQYRYRASGLVTDAVRNRVPVLVPDYPMLRHQIETPVPVGLVIRKEETLSAALSRALSAAYDFAGYAEARSLTVIAAGLRAAWGGGQSRHMITQLGVDNVSLAGLMDALFVKSSQPGLSVVNYANAHGCNLACRNKVFRDVMAKADLVFCDGVGVLLGARILGIRLQQRMTPPDWIDDFFRRCVQEEKSVFFVGEPQETLDAFRGVLGQKHPELRTAGFHHGYFAFDSEEEKALIRTLQAVRPDFILTGMGMPRQECWAERMRGELGGGLILSTGALFKWYAGVEVRKKSFLTDHGFEWLCRLLQHPVSLFGRYVIGNSIFLIRIFMQKLSKGIDQ